MRQDRDGDWVLGDCFCYSFPRGVSAYPCAFRLSRNRLFMPQIRNIRTLSAYVLRICALARVAGSVVKESGMEMDVEEAEGGVAFIIIRGRTSTPWAPTPLTLGSTPSLPPVVRSSSTCLRSIFWPRWGFGC